MKAIRRYNDRRKMQKGRQREKRQESRMASDGKIVDDTDHSWCGRDVSVGPFSVLLSKLPRGRDLALPPLLTAHPSPDCAKRRSTSHQPDGYWPIRRKRLVALIGCNV
jgi:hypothetical protein